MKNMLRFFGFAIGVIATGTAIAEWIKHPGAYPAWMYSACVLSFLNYLRIEVNEK